MFIFGRDIDSTGVLRYMSADGPVEVLKVVEKINEEKSESFVNESGQLVFASEYALAA